VTNRQRTPVVRRAARALALTPALLVTFATGAAFADPPASWPDNDSVPPLGPLLVLLVIPAALFVLITLLVYLPSMSKGEGYRPGQAWRGEPEWFGGPRGGIEAIDSSAPPAVGAGGTDTTRGGTSGRW
jgi:hypothetical protein